VEKVIPELLIIPHVFLVTVLDTLMTVMEKQENATIVFITPQVRLIILRCSTKWERNQHNTEVQ